MDKRREKSANYTRNEKHLLLDKALPYLDVIENKKTDTLTVEVKVRSWSHVTAQYNKANPKGQRKVTQLKNLYENIKKRTKKDLLIYQGKLKETGGKTSLRKIDDVGWRLVKTVPSLKALWKSILLMKQKLVNGQDISEIESLAISEMSFAPENIDYSVVVKEEYMPDNQEFLTAEGVGEVSDIPNASQQFPDENGTISASKDTNDTSDDIDLHSPQQEAPVNSFDVSNSLCEMEKEIKKKELEKLELEIQMKKLEVEFMKGRLREQEMNLKFKELEYAIKRKELDKK